MAGNVICIPQAGKFPGLPGLKPQWWDWTPANIPTPPSDVWANPQVPWAGLDDPRWAGSFQQSYGNGSTAAAGTAENVSFRALQFNDGTQSFLYLSWNIKVDPDTGVNSNDYVWVGFNLGINPNPMTHGPRSPSDVTPSTGAPAILIKIALTTSANAGVGTREGAVRLGPNGEPGSYGTYYSLTAFQNTIGGNTNWNAVPLATLSTWAWLAQYTRVWATPGPNPKWAIQMAVPVTSALALTQGLKLGNLFGMCYFAHVYSATIGSIPYKWPTSLADTTGTTTFPDPIDFPWCTPDISTLPANTQPAGQPPDGYACDITGITLPEDHIGTRNVTDPRTGLVNPQAIKYTAGSTTTFFARPVNNVPGVTIPAGSIEATFSLANWGSTAAQWTPITGSMTPHNPISPPPAPGNEEDIRMNWTANAADESFYSVHYHQCMLVTLSTSLPNLTFVQASAARNMDFVHASQFRRSAEINIRGLSPFSSQPRDVYLYVEKANMPTKADSEIIEQNKLVDKFMANLSEKHGDDDTLSLGSSNASFREIVKYIPTYRVHVYHDTGRRITIDGVSRPVLEPQPSFGYYVWHEGELYGWETRLYGAEKIAENLYHIRVPNDGVVTVETAIQARESEAETPMPPDGNPGCCGAIATWLDTKGPIGKIAAVVVRFFCRLLGQLTT